MNQSPATVHQPTLEPPPACPAKIEPLPTSEPLANKHEERQRLGGPQRLLMVTSIAGAQNCATTLGVLLITTVDAVTTRREALTALRNQEYSAVVLDDALAELDPQGAELLRRYAGSAMVLEVNFAISGVARLARQVRAELLRRNQQHESAMIRACSALASELKTSVAGLLLQLQLALDEPGISPQVASRLHSILQMATNLRQRLETPLPPA